MTHVKDQLVLVSLENGVATLTLNRPQARNALSQEMMSALEAALKQTASDAGARVVVIAAAGPAFCAGHDLKELRALGPQDTAQVFSQCARLMMAIVRHPRPVIAKVHALATAAGCQLVASCDLAYAADTARFATPGVNIGLFCSTPMVALSRAVGSKHAMEMLLTGDAIDAATAAAWGLITRAVPAGQLDDTVAEVTAKIASKSAATIRTGKAAFHIQREKTLADAYAYAAEVMAENMKAHDAQEGIDAFLQKRPACWRGD